MSQEFPSVPKRLPMSCGRSLMWLSLVMIASFPLFALAGHQMYGSAGVLSAAIAAGVCWFGAAAALLATALLQKSQPLGGALLGMIFRTGVPLVAGLVLQGNYPSLAAARIFGFILCYYLLALAVETFLAVRMIPRNSQVMKTS